MSPRIGIPGSVAVVTGAGSGIGRATALALATAGATVVCADIDGGAAEKTALACGEHGTDAWGRTVDVSDRSALDTLAREVETGLGPVGIVVNNAGVGMSGTFASMSAGDWEWIRSINLDGVVHGCAAFGPAMVGRGRGHIVNIASALAYTSTANETAYSTTKAGVLALSLALRGDWAASGVGVTAVCPGVINTAILERTRWVGSEQPTRDRERATRIFRRGHPPDKVAGAVVSAIRGDRAIVPVGVEAWAGWALHRYAPVAAQQFVARRRLP